MGKKARKRSSFSEKENGGCLWSFARVFEFSDNYNLRKFLADIKHGSARYHDERFSREGTSFSRNYLLKGIWGSNYDHVANEYDGHEETIILSRLPSVKVLIQEEMSKEKASIGLGCNRKLKQKTSKNNGNDSDCKIDIMMNSAHVPLEQFYGREPVKSSNSLLFELTSLIIEFYSASCYCSDTCDDIEVDLCSSIQSSGHSRHLSIKESDSHHVIKPKEILLVEAETFLTQKINDAKREDGKGAASQEFMDALEILNSNKDLFIKLVQNPNSLLLRQIQEILKPQIVNASTPCLDETIHLGGNPKNSNQNLKSINSQIFQQQKQNISKKNALWQGEDEQNKFTLHKHLSRKCDYSSAEISPSSSPAPQYSHFRKSSSPSGYTHFRKKPLKGNEKLISSFSFREIKRKFLSIISGDKKEHHAFFKNSLSKILNDCKCSSDMDRMNSEESAQIKGTSQTVCNNESIRLSFLAFDKADRYAEATKCQQKSKTETTKSKIQGLIPIPTSHSIPINKAASLSSVQSLKAIPQLNSDLNLEIPVENGQYQGFNGELDLEEKEETVEIENVRSVHINPVRIPVSSVCTESGLTSDICKDKSSTPSEQVTPNEKPRVLIPTSSISFSSFIINNSETSDDKQDRPSPISVLEQFFVEDDSPDHPRIIFDKLHEPLQPIHLSFYEDPAVITTSNSSMAHQKLNSYDMRTMKKIIRNMVESCSFDSEISAERWPSSELLLQPLLLDEIRTLRYSFSENWKLLLEFVNEVFLDSKNKQTLIFPWVTFIKQNVNPNLKNAIIEEVCKSIESYLSSQAQSSLNEIMSKDMGRTMWMDHRLEMGCIIEGLGCSIFEELIEEAITDIF